MLVLALLSNRQYILQPDSSLHAAGFGRPADLTKIGSRPSSFNIHTPATALRSIFEDIFDALINPIDNGIFHTLFDPKHLLSTQTNLAFQ